MQFILLNTTEIILLLFLVITFLQSGIDKIVDWNGNISWLKDHFKDTFLGKMVPLSVAIILIIELLAGLICLVGIIEIMAYGTRYFPTLGATLSCITLLMLLFGQRLAKDYEGAKTIAVYFIPAIFALYIFTS
jgi:uncharacterized membrane protein YphA (DoxX/SURF4 family)